MATELACRIRGTRVRLGEELKQEWDRASATDCEPLLLGDLKMGDKFIAMPSPGDNHGHGGLLGGSHLFIKGEKIYRPRFTNRCTCVCDGTSTLLPDIMFIIKID